MVGGCAGSVSDVTGGGCMFEFCILFINRVGESGVVHCPTERVADQVLGAFDGLVAVKYPTRRLV